MRGAKADYRWLQTFLSMTFFDYSDSIVSVSSSIWIYFLITVPLSIAILGGMTYWLRNRTNRGEGLDEEKLGKTA